jgi:small-conductance mechanosensitive channel
MFVLTLGDIIGLLLLFVTVVYIIYFFVSGRDKPKRQDAGVEAKKEVAPKKLSLLGCLLAIVMFAAIYFVLHWLLGFWH